MLSPKCWPFLGLNIRRLFMLVFHQGVSSTKVKKRNSAHFNIYKQNLVSVKKTTSYIFFIQLHRSTCRIPYESQGCDEHLFLFHIKPLHNVCANQVHQFAICTICIVYCTKYHTVQYRNHVLNRKKYIQ